MNNPQPLVSFVCKTVTLIALNINTDTNGINGCDIAFDIYNKLSRYYYYYHYHYYILSLLLTIVLLNKYANEL